MQYTNIPRKLHQSLNHPYANTNKAPIHNLLGERTLQNDPYKNSIDSELSTHVIKRAQSISDCKNQQIHLQDQRYQASPQDHDVSSLKYKKSQQPKQRKHSMNQYMRYSNNGSADQVDSLEHQSNSNNINDKRSLQQYQSLESKNININKEQRPSQQSNLGTIAKSSLHMGPYNSTMQDLKLKAQFKMRNQYNFERTSGKGFNTQANPSPDIQRRKFGSNRTSMHLKNQISLKFKHLQNQSSYLKRVGKQIFDQGIQNLDLKGKALSVYRYPKKSFTSDLENYNIKPPSFQTLIGGMQDGFSTLEAQEYSKLGNKIKSINNLKKAGNISDSSSSVGENLDTVDFVDIDSYLLTSQDKINEMFSSYENSSVTSEEEDGGIKQQPEKYQQQLHSNLSVTSKGNQRLTIQGIARLKTKTNNVMKSQREKFKRKQKMIQTKKNSLLNRLVEQEKKILDKFKDCMKQSEMFQGLLKKLAIIKPKVDSDEYKRTISNMSEISGLNRQDTDKCVKRLSLTLKQKLKAKKFRDKFKQMIILNQKSQEDLNSGSQIMEIQAQSIQIQKMTLAVNPQQNKVQGNLIKWKEGQKLGCGTFGEVVRAINCKNATIFAVKKVNFFSAASGVNQEIIANLKSEIEVMKKLEHENIVKYIGAEIVNNQFCIYLEYIPGGSICNIYQKFGALTEPMIKTYTKQILNGLIYLHNNKIVHCDLKGANILVDSNGKIKLADFGCSKTFEASLSNLKGQIKGSLPWMAPEIIVNKGYGRKADVWSLGCVIVEMAVGGNPWGNELFNSQYDAVLKIANSNLLPFIPNTLSEDCKDFILQCLSRNTMQRPTSEELLKHPFKQQEEIKHQQVSNPNNNNSYDLNDSISDDEEEDKDPEVQRSLLKRDSMVLSDKTESYQSNESKIKHSPNQLNKFIYVKESAKPFNSDLNKHEQVRQVMATSGPEQDGDEDSIQEKFNSIGKQKQKEAINTVHHNNKQQKALYHQRPLSNLNMNKLMDDINQRITNANFQRSPKEGLHHARAMTFDDIIKNSKLHLVEISKEPKFINDKQNNEESKRKISNSINYQSAIDNSCNIQSEKGIHAMQMTSPKQVIVNKPPMPKRNLKLQILDEEVALKLNQENNINIQCKIQNLQNQQDAEKLESILQGQNYSCIKKTRNDDLMNSQMSSRIQQNQSNMMVTENSLFQAMNQGDKSQLLQLTASFLIGESGQILDEKEINLQIGNFGNGDDDDDDIAYDDDDELKVDHKGDVTFIESNEADTPEKLGLIVKKTIESAHKGQIINLPDTHIKVTDLLILKPITVKGRPGTILEITKGSIIIDFDQEEERSQKEVGIICECDIVFSDRADQIQIKEELDREEFSPKENMRLGKYPQNRHNLELSPQIQCNQISNTENSGLYALFQIRNYTYVEVRDCSLTSKNKQSLLDAAFVMNEKELFDPYKCILSVKSCNIKNFSVGFLTGPNSMLSVELSYITDCRLSGIMCSNPKLLKLSGTVIENVDGHGVDIKLYNQDERSKDTVKKIYIEDNKIQNCKESGIFVHGLVTSSLDQFVIEQQNVNAIVKMFKNRIYLNKQAGIHLKRLNIQQLEINNCDLYYNDECNILMSKVKPKTLEQVVIVKSRIAEAENGIIAKDCLSFTISDTEFSKNKKSGLSIVDSGAEKNFIRSEIVSNAFPIFEKPNIIIGSQGGNEWIADEREELALNRNLTAGNTGRIHQGLITSTLISAVGVMRPDMMNNSSIINTMNNQMMILPSSMNNIQTNGMSTQPHTSIPLKPISSTSLQQQQKKQKQKVFVGEVYITKCKFIDNKMHGIHLQNIYQKSVEINSCRMKDNFLNGIYIAQDLDNDDEVIKQIHNQQNNASSDKIQITDNINNMTSLNNINNSKLLIIRKDIIKYAKVVVSNCEIQLNKLHGIEMSLVRTIVKHCVIKDNMQCAIKLTTQNSKMLLKLYDSINKGKPMIKGKVGGEWGELTNPIKELQTEEDQESELGMFLKNVADVEDADNLQLGSGKGKTTARCFKCIAKPQKKQLDSLGEYVIIKEARNDKNIGGQRGGLFRTCMTPTASSSSNKMSKQNNRNNDCIIF